MLFRVEIWTNVWLWASFVHAFLFSLKKNVIAVFPLTSVFCGPGWVLFCINCSEKNSTWYNLQDTQFSLTYNSKLQYRLPALVGGLMLCDSSMEAIVIKLHRMSCLNSLPSCDPARQGQIFCCNVPYENKMPCCIWTVMFCCWCVCVVFFLFF